jgi:hypothetical protein
MSSRKSDPSDNIEAPEKKSFQIDTADPHDLSDVDWRINRLKDNHLSPAPYLLKILGPSTYKPPPFAKYEWRYTWHNRHPFDKNEEQLQYVSFLRQAWENTVLLPFGNWDDGKGRIMEENSTKTDSLPGTPILGASTAKKKMTMQDYLKRQGKQDSMSPPSQKPIKIQSQRKDKGEGKTNGQSRKMGKESVAVEVPRKNLHLNGGREKSPIPQTAGKKRPLENSEGPSYEKSVPKQDSHRLEKKQRLESTPQAAPRKPSPAPKPSNTDIPQRISPSLPPALSDGLPLLLSPTLPPALESDLKNLSTLSNGTLGHNKTDSASSGLSDTKKSKIQEKPLASPKPKRSTPHLSNGSKEASKATPSPSFTASKSDKAVKAHKPSDSDVSQKSVFLNGLKPTPSQQPDRTREPKSRIVRLKYGRKNKVQIGRILRMHQRPKKVFDDSLTKKTKEEASRIQKDKVQKVDDSKTKSPLVRPEKRVRPTDEEESSSQSIKRQKVPSSLNLTDKPKTPVPVSFKSPAFSKTTFSTPKKDLKSVAMRRVDSGDGDARTPSGARSGTPTAPNSVERGSLAKNSPPNTSGGLDSRQEQKRLWKLEASKYEQLARSLKHQADKHLKTKEGPTANVSDEEAKLGCVTALESILCYMLSFFCTDQSTIISIGRPGPDANHWLTIVPYWYYVRERVEAYPDLRGLCFQIGALLREIICVADMEKLAQDPLPKNSGDGISPPSDAGNMTPNSAKAAQYHRDYVDFKSRLVSNFNKARALWIEGSKDLSLQRIMHSYPKTWAMQEKDVTGKGQEKFVPGKYHGPFFLPLAGTSSPMEAVRFGIGFLGEWCKKEGIKWDPKIGL